MKKLLVLGVGNLLLKDDGVGVHAVNILQEENYPREQLDFMDGGTFTQDIFFSFKGYEKLLVLDAVYGGKKPGTMYRLTEQDLRQGTVERLSLHDVDLLDSLQMAEISGYKPELIVIGIEPAIMNEWSMELSDVLQKEFQNFLKAIRLEIAKIII